MNKHDLLSILRMLKNSADKRENPEYTSIFEAGYSTAVNDLLESIKEYDPRFYEEFEYYSYCIEHRGISFDEFSEALNILRG